MPVSPFGVRSQEPQQQSPFSQGGMSPSQQAAMQGLQGQGALGTAPTMEGSNPVAMHLVAALRALVARGGQPEDIAAVQQFLDALQQLGGGAPQPGAMMGAQPMPPGQGPPPQAPLGQA